MKYNDVTVTDTTWEDLQKESIGGYHNASAYCLMYIDSNRKDIVNCESKYCIERDSLHKRSLILSAF